MSRDHSDAFPEVASAGTDQHAATPRAFSRSSEGNRLDTQEIFRGVREATPPGRRPKMSTFAAPAEETGA
jgi:hypothetical protein